MLTFINYVIWTVRKLFMLLLPGCAVLIQHSWRLEILKLRNTKRQQFVVMLSIFPLHAESLVTRLIFLKSYYSRSNKRRNINYGPNSIGIRELQWFPFKQENPLSLYGWIWGLVRRNTSKLCICRSLSNADEIVRCCRSLCGVSVQGIPFLEACWERSSHSLRR